MASTLQELRKAAGYKTAKEFAREMVIPLATYARYESTPEKIPLAAAWSLADKLGCSIDLVVGREELGAPAGCDGDPRGPVQRLYDGLSPQLKDAHDEYLSFLVAKNANEERRREAEERARMDALCRRFEHMMWVEPDFEERYGEVATFGTLAERREQFREYFVSRSAKLRAGAKDEAGLAQRDEERVERVMEAWDRAHGQLGFEWAPSSHVVDMGAAGRGSRKDS